MPSNSSTATAAPVDVLKRGGFHTAPARKRQFEPAEGSSAVPVPDYGKHAEVHRGTRARDGLPVFYLEHGDQFMALPNCAVGAAIAAGLLTVEEFVACLVPATAVNAVTKQVSDAIKAAR